MLTDNKDNDLAKKIYEENVRVHRFEAPIYERIHPEIFNHRVQQELQEDLSLVRKLLPSPNPFASFEGRPSALDIGCGTGNISVKLLKLGFRVTAVDISQEMLDVFQDFRKSFFIRLCGNIKNELYRKFPLISSACPLRKLTASLFVCGCYFTGLLRSIILSQITMPRQGLMIST